ncbi:MAG: carboxypeptidase regulatory-like domain-containing protein [Bacteroides sp.]|nr:carboxypeptidase regulatory-like domain-containing protein [Bacteroides sp.]
MKTRLIYLLLILCSLQLTVTAQTDKRITLDFRNEALPSALKKLEQASGYRILFTYDDIQTYKVTTSIQNETITQAISDLLKDKPLNYTLKGDQYVVVVSASVKSVNSLKGQVLDEQSMPMESTTIMLKKGEKVVTGSITDAAGNYFIPNIPAGDYELCISFFGIRNLYPTHPDNNRYSPATHNPERRCSSYGRSYSDRLRTRIQNERRKRDCQCSQFRTEPRNQSTGRTP